MRGLIIFLLAIWAFLSAINLLAEYLEWFGIVRVEDSIVHTPLSKMFKNAQVIFMVLAFVIVNITYLVQVY